MDEFEPLIILAIPNLSDEQTWFETTVQPIIDSMAFGAPAPVIDGGAATLSTFGADAIELEVPAEGVAMPAGTYSTVKPFGMPVSFDVPDRFRVEGGLQGPSCAGCSAPTRRRSGSTRFGSFYDAQQALDPDMNGVGSIPADDMDAWIEANGIIVDDSAEGTIGGRSAYFRQIRLPEGTGDGLCPAAMQPCIKVGSHSADLQGNYVHAIDGTLPNAYWFVEMDDFEPFGIWISTTEARWPPGLARRGRADARQHQFGDPAPTVEGGTARVPERIAVTANMTVTQTGERDINEPWPIERTGPIVGDINGTFTGTGISSPNGAEVTLDWVMDVTIDGLGTGTLTLRSDEVWTGDGATTAADRVIAGTGDFDGVTGFGTTTHTDDGTVHGDIELTLAPRR